MFHCIFYRSLNYSIFCNTFSELFLWFSTKLEIFTVIRHCGCLLGLGSQIKARHSKDGRWFRVWLKTMSMGLLSQTEATTKEEPMPGNDGWLRSEQYLLLCFCGARNTYVAHWSASCLLSESTYCHWHTPLQNPSFIVIISLFEDRQSFPSCCWGHSVLKKMILSNRTTVDVNPVQYSLFWCNSWSSKSHHEADNTQVLIKKVLVSCSRVLQHVAVGG